MADVSQLLSLYETTESLTEAKTALDQIAATEHPEDLELGEYYDDLATVAAEYDDFALAAEAERLAIEHGCRPSNLAEDMLGWYLLKDGKREEGEAVFTASVAQRGDDPELHGTIGAARRDAGDTEGALRAFDRALELAEGAAVSASAKNHRDRSRVSRFRAERQECRDELGLPADQSDRIAGIAIPGFPDTEAYAVAWFPREEIDAALTRWPSLAGNLGDPDSYCRIVEARLCEVRSKTGRVPSVAPLSVEALVEFANARGLDPESGEASSQLASALCGRDEVVPWPPGRNDPCWCGSGRKYKRCCG